MAQIFRDIWYLIVMNDDNVNYCSMEYTYKLNWLANLIIKLLRTAMLALRMIIFSYFLNALQIKINADLKLKLPSFVLLRVLIYIKTFIKKCIQPFQVRFT